MAGNKYLVICPGDYHAAVKIFDTPADAKAFIEEHWIPSGSTTGVIYEVTGRTWKLESKVVKTWEREEPVQRQGGF